MRGLLKFVDKLLNEIVDVIESLGGVLVRFLSQGIALGLVLALVPIVSLWYAYAASWLWEWFVVPIFNLPPLSAWQMWGLTLTLTAIRPYSPFGATDLKNVETTKQIGVWTAPAVSLLWGFLIKSWA